MLLKSALAGFASTSCSTLVPILMQVERGRQLKPKKEKTKEIESSLTFPRRDMIYDSRERLALPLRLAMFTIFCFFIQKYIYVSSRHVYVYQRAIQRRCKSCGDAMSADIKVRKSESPEM